MWVVRGPSNYVDTRVESSTTAELGLVWIGTYDNILPNQIGLVYQGPSLNLRPRTLV
jgi:hypothetical protein